MKKWERFVPYFIVLAFCLINVGIVGPNKKYKVRLPFFNWCLFCSADAQYVKYYEVQIQKPNEQKIVLNSRDNRNQKDSIRVNDIISMYTKSQLTAKHLRELLGNKDATVSLYEVSCDVHQWFLYNYCGPTKLLAAYEI